MNQKSSLFPQETKKLERNTASQQRILKEEEKEKIDLILFLLDKFVLGTLLLLILRKLPLSSFWEGDYKLILIMLGLKGATAFYACAWCKVHKDHRWNINYESEFYNCLQMKRTLQGVRDLAKKSKDDYCREHEPLLNIELDHVILDELYLLLRIVDVLLGNLLKEVREWDIKEELNKKRG